MMIDVVAAIIKKDDEILIAQKNKEDRHLPLLWEFPGGKKEQEETLEEALVREIKEELNIDIKCDSYFGVSIYHYEHISIRLIAYWCTWIAGEIKIKEHQAINWVTVDKLQNYMFAPADIPLVKVLMDKNSN